MAVRTEKIQALTGSAPLTLPKTLPTSEKGLQVSTTGVITAPDTADSMSNFVASTGGEAGWHMFTHEEIEAASNPIELKRPTSSTYASSDIYVWEVRFHFMVYRTNSTTNIHIRPMVGDDVKPNGNGYRSEGICFQNSGGKSSYSWSGNGANNTTAYVGSIRCQNQSMSSPTGNTYAQMFDKNKAPYSGSYGGSFGAYGRFRWFNGNAYQGFNIDPWGYHNRTNANYDAQNNRMGATAASMPGNVEPTYDAKIDGFQFYCDNNNDVIMGFMQLWGMPKAVT